MIKSFKVRSKCSKNSILTGEVTVVVTVKTNKTALITIIQALEEFITLIAEGIIFNSLLEVMVDGEEAMIQIIEEDKPFGREADSNLLPVLGAEHLNMLTNMQERKSLTRKS